MKQAKNKNYRDGLRTQIREEIVGGSGALPDTNVLTATLAANTTSNNGGVIFTPKGLQGVVAANTTPVTFIQGAAGNIEPPHLRKFYNMSVDFKSYRVLSGKVVFTPNVGSTTTGQLVMASYRDPMDSTVVPQVAFASGPNYRVFNLSQTNKEISIPLDIDPSWKKVTDILTYPRSSPWGGSSTAGTFVTVNSASDLCFSSFCWLLVNPVQSANEVKYGNFSVVIEVEFKGLIDSAINL
nr:hypothetical protein [Actinidia tombus-like virus]